jgi:hypothetical protein
MANNTMRRITTRVISLALALAPGYIAYADEPILTTFNGTRFEPLLKAEAGEIILNRLDSVSPETKEALIGNFKVIPLPGNSLFNTYYTRGFYVIGETGEKERYFYAEGLSEVIIPSSNGDRYLLSTGNVPMSLEGYWGTAPARELYSADGDLIWHYEYLPGYPRASADLSLVCVLRPGGVLTLIDDEGETATIKHQCWVTPLLVSGKGDKILLNDYEKGTVILDGRGEEISRLKDGYLGWTLRLIGSIPDVQSYYISSDFIIQLCRKLEVRNHRIQVYNGDARLLWERKFPWQEQHGLRFGISPNEEFLLICIRLPEPKCELYRTKNGARLRKIRFEEEDFYRFVECGVTDDGRRSFVTTLDNTNLKSKTFVFEKGEKIAEFHTVAAENAACTYPLVEFSCDGSFIAVSFEKGFSIYRISTD